ncbi:hypothetical protein Bca101_029855 [Brassica carinata]
MVPIVAASPLSFFAMTNAWFNRVCFVSFGEQVSTTRCRFQSSPTFQIEPWFLFARTSLLVVKLSEGIFSVYSWNKSYLVLDSLTLPQYEDLTLPQYEDVTLIYLVGSGLWFLWFSGIDAFKNGVEALALQEALLSASCAGTLEASSNFRL